MKSVIVALTYCVSVFVAKADVVPGSLEDLARFRKPSREIKMVVDGFLWVEAEDFTDYGEWRLDTQFVAFMGSPYLLAGGVGKPIKDATTEIQIPRAGRYRLWVRAKNWIKEFAPGQFTVSVSGQRSTHIFGAAPTESWVWECGGDFDLAKGLVTLALHDLTGYFARCDALILTTNLQYTPPADPAELQRERQRLTGSSEAIKSEADYEVIVVGGGTAGCCAAIAAARLGARTALIQDRPVLGGNASTELGVPPQGASVSHPNARESGLIEEAQLIRARHGYPKWSEAFQAMASAETNLTVLLNKRVVGAVMKDKQTIAAVRAVDTLTLEPSLYRGQLFIDCTGDGWLGYYAGAMYRLGRESREEFGEDLAPPQADQITMSGCIMGNLCLSYRAEDMGRPVAYTPPPWAAKLPPASEFGRKIKGFVTGQWWLEHSGDVDDLFDPERARDELIRITFGYWGFIKNQWEEKERARRYALTYVPHMNAKRETRRLLGDYILKQQDAQNGVMFPDRISYGGWGLDVHHARGIFSGKEGPFHCNPRVPIYSIPFRSIYSANIVNLLFAGRNMSVTHIALGTVRVEATLATVGQAAGTAAALCLQHQVAPRELGQRYISELQQTLLKYDQYIPELKNEDPTDLARTATVAASSTQRYVELARENVRATESHELTTPRAVMFARGATDRLRVVNLLLSSTRQEPVELTLRLRGATALGDFSATNDLATATAKLSPGGRKYVAFHVDCPVAQPYLWVMLPKTPGVSWWLMDRALPEAVRAYGGDEKRRWTVVKNQQYAFYTEPALRFPTDHRPENVIDGVARIVGANSHLWVSDPRQPLPQWIELAFPNPVELNTVHVTFDTELNARAPAAPVVRQCVRDYRLACLVGADWKDLLTVKSNFLRHRIHRFPAVSTSRLRLIVEATNGDPSARVFEIRAYRE